jgi:hypothetical protein
MQKPASSLEKAVANYFRTGVSIEQYMCQSDDVHIDEFAEEWVEIAILPGYSTSNLDAMWIQSINNSRIGAGLYPDENLKRFFSVMNVHPRDVLTSTHFDFTPVSSNELHLDLDYCKWLNKRNSEVISKYFDLLNDFEVDKNRPALCDVKDATAIIDNASHGGWPLIAGYAKVSEILSLEFEKEIVIDGNFQVGIWDNVNGSGHCELAKKGPFTMKLERGDFIGLATQGWTPDHSCGFVHRYYQFALSNAKSSTANAVF